MRSTTGTRSHCLITDVDLYSFLMTEDARVSLTSDAQVTLAILDGFGDEVDLANPVGATALLPCPRCCG